MNLTKLALAFSTLLLTHTVTASNNRAVEININGIGPAVDAAAFTTVRQVIGAAVANGVIDKFVVYGYGFEGGFTACAQARPKSKGFPSFVRQLRSIAPRPETTAYNVRLTATCETDQRTFCPQDVYQCPDGSYVGRLPPTCEFAPCPGN